MDQTSSRIKPLNHSALRGVLSEVSSFYNNCSEQVKFIIGSMSIKMKELVIQGVKQSSVLSIDIQNSATDKVLSLTRDIVMQYQSVFSSRNEAFNNVLSQSQPMVAKPSAANISTASKQRWKRRSESSTQALANKKQSLKVASLPGLKLGVIANDKPKLKKVAVFVVRKHLIPSSNALSGKHYRAKAKNMMFSKVATQNHSQAELSCLCLSQELSMSTPVTLTH